MVEFVAGVTVGGLLMTAKDKMFGNRGNQQVAAQQREMDEIYKENEKFRNRNKEMERQIEDLLSENQKLRKQYKDKDDKHDDLEDDLQDAQKEVKKLRMQNDDLCRKIQEYKTACENYKLDIERLKDQVMK